MEKSYIQIHFILENTLRFKRLVKHAPSIGDEIRIGGIENEEFFTVVRKVWAYDEPEACTERLNIEIKPVK